MDYSFERTELRALQNSCKGDNEVFLNMIAIIVGKQDKLLEELKEKVGMMEHKIRGLEFD